MKQPVSSEVAIIGGGVIGLLTARELVRAGVSVSLFDRQAVARESSWAGGGILSPLYPWRYPEAVTRLAGWSQLHYPDICRDLHDQSGLDPQYIKSGLLIYSPKENDIAVKWSENHKKIVKLIEPAEVGGIQPGAIEFDGPWLWMPEVAQVRNPFLLRALKANLVENGVKIIENAAITGISIQNGRVTGIRSEGKVWFAERYLIAAGAWSAGLLADTGLSLQVQPVRGQMLLLQGPPGLLTRIMLVNDHYLIPRRDGRILVGSTLEFEGFDKSTTAGAAASLKQAAEAILPGILQQCEIETQWAGLRPGSPEGVPYIGSHPEVENLFISTGHYRNGFVLGPASARLMTDLMLGRDPVVAPTAYELGRD